MTREAAVLHVCDSCVRTRGTLVSQALAVGTAPRKSGIQTSETEGAALGSGLGVQGRPSGAGQWQWVRFLELVWC